jgi:hypothetical protein
MIVGGSVVDSGDGTVVCEGTCGVLFIHPELKRITKRIPIAAEKWIDFIFLLHLL